METSNKEAGDLQEEGEIPGIIDDHGILFIATYKYIRQLCGWWLGLGCRAFSAGWWKRSRGGDCGGRDRSRSPVMISRYQPGGPDGRVPRTPARRASRNWEADHLRPLRRPYHGRYHHRETRDWDPRERLQADSSSGALTMTTTVTATQAMVSVRKFSEMLPAQWQTMGFSLWSTSALNPMHATMASHQVIPKRTVTASPQLSVEQIHGSISTTRETLSQSRLRRLPTADSPRPNGRSHSPGLMDRHQSLPPTATQWEDKSTRGVEDLFNARTAATPSFQ